MMTLKRLLAFCLLLGITQMAGADLLPRPRPRPQPLPLPYPPYPVPYPVPVPVPVQPPRYLPAPDPLPPKNPALEFWGNKDVKLGSMPLVVEIDDRLDEARITIPSQAFHFRSALDGEDADAGRADGGGRPAINTMVAGLSLALALSFGGVWLVRRGNPATVGRAVPLAALACAAVFGSAVGAWQAGPRFAPGAAEGERVTVIIKANFDDKVRLIVSKKQLAKLVQQAK